MSKKAKMTKDIVPDGFSLGLAIYDACPVILFCISVILLGVALRSPLFLLGGILCAWAGVTKVIWKIIVVVKRKNIWWMFMQMRICMPIGFIIMILAGILCRKQEYGAELLLFARTYPVSLFFWAGFVGLLLMGVAGATLNSADPRANWIEQTINTIAQLSLLMGVILLTISVGYYKADGIAAEALRSDDQVSVELQQGRVVFTPVDGTSSNGTSLDGLIFYPGGKVEYTAYAPLMRELAKAGITCVLVEMPLNYAFLNSDAADAVIEELPQIRNWYLAGHSLGGAFGSIYAADHTDKLSGVILMGAYSTKSLAQLQVLSIYGSEDGVMQRDKYEKYKGNLPSDYTELIMEGGNHAMFGSYGPQQGDGQGLITAEEQWRITTEAIINFMK